MKEKIYEEVGANYRFFLTWRHATVAGYFVIMYGIITLTISIYKDAPKLAGIVPFLGAFIGWGFWLIDRRTQEIYHAAIRAGKELEGFRGGFYSQVSKIILPPGSSPFKKNSHSGIIKVLFIGSSILLFILAIILLILSNYGSIVSIVSGQ